MWKAKKVLFALESNTGFTMTEILVALTILSIAVVAILGAFYTSLRGISTARARTIATNLANQQMETVRNMAYDEIGTTTGWPSGDIPSTQTATSSNVTFTIKISVSYIDDDYDGKATGTTPQDLYPYDYKRVKVTVNWDTIPCSSPVKVTSDVAPEGPETATDTGTISIQVLDASGEPVPDAELNIENSNVTPSIDIEDTADNEGKLLVPSLPPDDGYYVSATKFGYSTDSTTPETVENPNPEKPNLSVIVAEVSEITLIIDGLGTLSIDFVYDDGNGGGGPLAGAEISLTGGKLLGTDPEIPKYSEDLTADSSGHLSLSDMEWDSYTVKLRGDTATGYEISGASPETWEVEELEDGTKVVVISLEPDTTETETITLTPR